jgi:prepilin-type N-terminal cleavage/methylation domain-containing protein
VNRPSDAPASGFTLIEVLLAMVIAGIVLTTVYGALSRTLSSKARAEERAELYASAREVLMKMSDELEASLHPQFGGRNFFVGSGGGGGQSFVQFITMDRGAYGATRRRPGRMIVQYFLYPLPDQRGVYSLFRQQHWFRAFLAQEHLAPLPLDMEEGEDDPALQPIMVPLLDCPQGDVELNLPGSCLRVVDLDFSFFDAEYGDWRDDWSSIVEDGPMYNRLPGAVWIRLVLADERGAEYDFSTVVDLPLARGQPTPGPDGSVGEEEPDEDLDEETEPAPFGLDGFLTGQGRR